MNWILEWSLWLFCNTEFIWSLHEKCNHLVLRWAYNSAAIALRRSVPAVLSLLISERDGGTYARLISGSASSTLNLLSLLLFSSVFVVKFSILFTSYSSSLLSSESRCSISPSRIPLSLSFWSIQMLWRTQQTKMIFVHFLTSRTYRCFQRKRHLTVNKLKVCSIFCLVLEWTSLK